MGAHADVEPSGGGSRDRADREAARRFPWRRGIDPYGPEFAQWDTHPDNPRRRGAAWAAWIAAEAARAGGGAP